MREKIPISRFTIRILYCKTKKASFFIFRWILVKMDASKINFILELSTEQNETENPVFGNGNVTFEILDEVLYLNEQFKPIIDILLVLILAIIMLAMGCEITWSEVNYFSCFLFKIFLWLIINIFRISYQSMEAIKGEMEVKPGSLPFSKFSNLLNCILFFPENLEIKY